MNLETQGMILAAVMFLPLAVVLVVAGAIFFWNFFAEARRRRRMSRQFIEAEVAAWDRKDDAIQAARRREAEVEWDRKGRTALGPKTAQTTEPAAPAQAPLSETVYVPPSNDLLWDNTPVDTGTNDSGSSSFDGSGSSSFDGGSSDGGGSSGSFD